LKRLAANVALWKSGLTTTRCRTRPPDPNSKPTPHAFNALDVAYLQQTLPDSSTAWAPQSPLPCLETPSHRVIHSQARTHHVLGLRPRAHTHATRPRPELYPSLSLLQPRPLIPSLPSQSPAGCPCPPPPLAPAARHQIIHAERGKKNPNMKRMRHTAAATVPWPRHAVLSNTRAANAQRGFGGVASTYPRGSLAAGQARPSTSNWPFIVSSASQRCLRNERVRFLCSRRDSVPDLRAIPRVDCSRERPDRLNTRPGFDHHRPGQ
jgi:hypothetical protein